jgi:HEAT repeat protein
MREQLNDSSWRETALFYAGLGDAQDIVSAMVEQGDLYFAASALASNPEPPAALLEQVVKALVSRAWDDYDERAMRSLGELRSNMASDFFAAKLRDKNAEVRERAAYILGKLHTDRALEYLLPQLRDPSPEVRDTVIASLGQSRSERVVEPLLVALRGDPRVASSDTRMKIAAAKALGEYGTEKSAPALLVDMQVSDADLREQSIIALEKIRSPFAVKPLMSIAETDKHEEVRQAAARVLSSMQGK